MLFVIHRLDSSSCPIPLLSAQALIDGPVTGVPRHMIPFKRLALTDFKLNIQRNARIGTITKAVKVGSRRGGVSKSFREMACTGDSL